MGVMVSLLTSAPSPNVSGSTAVYELGTRIAIDVPGRIMAIRFWRLPDDDSQHLGHIWSALGLELANVEFVPAVSGWQEQALEIPLVIAPGQFTVSVDTPIGEHFAVLSGGLSLALKNGPLSSPASGGSYGSVGDFPNLPSPHDYYCDIVFEVEGGTITIAPDAGGGFAATLNGFSEGPYTLEVAVTSVRGTVTSATREIVMPIQGPQ